MTKPAGRRQRMARVIEDLDVRSHDRVRTDRQSRRDTQRRLISNRHPIADDQLGIAAPGKTDEPRVLSANDAIASDVNLPRTVDLRNRAFDRDTTAKGCTPIPEERLAIEDLQEHRPPPLESKLALGV